MSKKTQMKPVQLNALKIEYVSPKDVLPNKYNPNRQSPNEFQMLCRSIEEDGFTQPVIVHAKTKEIVDGEHRWRAAQALKMAKIPVVFVDMTEEQRRIATLRHNRARGTEQYELAIEVVRDLEKLGALDWAKHSLMLSDADVEQMLKATSAAEGLAGEEFSEAWIPERSDRGHDSETSTATMSSTERVKAAPEEKRYHLSMTFLKPEGDEIRDALGDKPADALLRICRKANEGKSKKVKEETKGKKSKA